MRRLVFASLLVLPAACGSDPASPDAAPAIDAAAIDAAYVPRTCAERGLAESPWSAGPYGTLRGELAEDFTVDLVGGGTFSLQGAWTGCDSVVFVPDSLTTSALDPTPLWNNDLALLLQTSSPNVHYVFVSRSSNLGTADANAAAMAARIDDVLGTLDADDARWWRDHLHVVDGTSATLGNWLTGVLAGHGRNGFAIDRGQRIRGVGSLADVSRFDQALDDAGQWPWRNNLAYVAHEVRYFDAQAALDARLAEDGATVVSLWTGETLAELATTTVTLPDAATMAGFDTLEVEVDTDCPNQTAPELGNCGAWDYLAHLFVGEGKGEVEVARFITPYHRGARWVVDATAALPFLADGGTHTFRYSFAPPWNTQPTRTKLSLRLSNQGKGVRPVAAIPLFAGGDFNSAYNTGRVPLDVAIPADAERVELVAIVTGHGAATNQCAEFCNHQHRFTIAGTTHDIAFPEAATDDGCIDAIDGYEIPNQGGTWWFGRGGWCPGAPVAPHVFDVTADVTPGQTASIAYEGRFNNTAPPPDNSGNIVLSSWLVVYR